MALVADDVFSVSFAFRDNNGKLAACSVYYPGTLPYGDVVTAATALAADLQAISNAALVGINISGGLTEDAPITPQPESEVERKLRIPLGTAIRENASSVEIPSPVFSIETPGTDVVSPTNLLLSAVLAELTLGELGAGNGIVTAYGDDITRAGVATVVHRSRRPRR